MTLLAILATVASVIRQWRRNHCERRLLASLSAHERYELGFVGDVDAEIAKPFWRD